MGHSHASGMRLSKDRARATPGLKMPQQPVLSELGNPERSDNGALSLRHCSRHAAPLLCPSRVGGLGVACDLEHSCRATGPLTCTFI